MSSRSIRILAPTAGDPSVAVTWPSMAEIWADAAPANSRKQNAYGTYRRDLANIAISSPGEPFQLQHTKSRHSCRGTAESIGDAQDVGLSVIDDAGIKRAFG